MALSKPASNTAVSATPTRDIDLSSATSMLTVQDPSTPTPGKCYIEECVVETLIQVAESLDYKSLCALSRVSKKFPEAAQDVLYRFVDLRPAEKDLEEEYRRNDRPTKSGVAVFLWTIKRKPHLATKVRDLWFLPRRDSVPYPQLGYAGVSLVSPHIGYSDAVTEVRETQLACDLLARVTELRSLTVTALDDFVCQTQLGDPDRHSLETKVPYTVSGRLPIGLGKLIDWAILTLPTLHTLCIGSEVILQLPSELSQALNITSLILEAVKEELGDVPGRAIRFLAHLPNVNALTLGSCAPNGQNPRFPQRRDRRHSELFGNLGAFSLGLIRAFLTVGRSIKNLTFTYSKPVQFRDTTTIRLDIKAFEQVRRLETAECALVDSHNFHRLAGSDPSDLLPRSIRTPVITHPRSPGQGDGNRKSKLTSWLGELTKTDFPDLERVEVVCSVGHGDDVGFKQRLEQSEEVQDLKTIGVAVVIRKE